MAVSHGTYTIVDVMDGELGVNTATIYLYKRSNGTPTGLPAGNVKYKFSEHRIIEGTLNGWVEDISELSVTGYPIYMIMATASAPSDEDTDIIDTEEWAGPIEIAKDGEPGTPGYNQATIYLYQRTNNPSALVVPTSATYNFHTGVLSNIGNWSREIPNNTGSNGPCYVISAAAIGTGETYSSFVWSSISKLVEDGEDGITITTVLYGISNDSSTEPSRWDTNPPTDVAQGSWLWIKTVYSDNSFVISKSYTGVDGGSIEIESTSIQYQVSNSGTVVPTGEWHDTVQQTTTGEFLWTRTIISYSDGSSTTAYSVAAHGEAGSQGTSVIKTENFYYLKPSGGTAPTPETEGSVEVPDFTDGGTYYKRTVTYLSVGGPIKGNWEIDGALTSENQKALDAFVDAGIAKQRTRKVISNSNEGVTVAAGINGGEITPGTISTYGYNTIMDPNYLGLRYNDINLAKLTTTGLEFYYPTINNDVVVQGQKGMELGASALKFFRYGNLDTTPDAQLSSNGLEIINGFIQFGLGGPSGTTDGNVRLSNIDFTRSINGINKNNLRFAIGGNFGIRNDGTVYANNADVTGFITATSLTIQGGSGSSTYVYDGNSAINASGYSIEIIEDTSAAPRIIDTDIETYLYPILYLNGVAIPTSDIVFTNFKWYKDSTEIAYDGDSAHGGHISEYGHTYRVTYQFDDTAVGEAPVVQEVKITDEKYITEINERGIRVHPEDTSRNNYIQIADNIEICRNGISVAEYGTVMRIGDNNSSHFLINSDSLQAFSSTDATNPYFEVNANGLRWGSNTAATTTQVYNAAQTATNYIKIDGNGIKLQNTDDTANYLFMDSTKIAFYRNNIEKMQCTDSSFRLGDILNYINLNEDGVELFKDNSSIALFKEFTRVGSFDSSITITSDSISGIANNINMFSINASDATMLVAKYINFNVLDSMTNIIYSLPEIPINGTTISFNLGGAHKNIYYGSASFQAGVDDSQIIRLKEWDDETYTTQYTAYVAYNTNNNTITLTSFSEIRNINYYGSIFYYVNGLAPSYTFGIRKDGYSIGGYSAAFGKDCVASGDCSYAEGNETYATGEVSHAEGGLGTKASGSASHAEGMGTKASGSCSHTEGSSTSASGSWSHAQNIGTIAARHAQTAIGKYNIQDDYDTAYGKYALIVGNGSSNNYRNDAFTIGWDGTVQISGSTVHSSDRRLKDHQSYLSTDAIQFIQSLKPAYFKKNEQSHVGFYAQDVEAADPWNCMVGEMNGFKTLGYTEIIAPLVAYCQHLEQRLKQLEEKE